MGDEGLAQKWRTMHNICTVPAAIYLIHGQLFLSLIYDFIQKLQALLATQRFHPEYVSWFDYFNNLQLVIRKLHISFKKVHQNKSALVAND